MRSLLVLIFIVSPLGLARGTVVDFEDLNLIFETAVGGDPSETPFHSHGVEFPTTWNHEFGCCPGGWAYSNKTDLTTGGFTNPFSAYSLPDGGGVEGSANFAVAFNPARGDSRVIFPGPSRIDGMFVTNTTYAYLAAADGNDGGVNFVKGPFGEGDFFRLEIFGVDADGMDTGSVDFLLSDFIQQKTGTISDWTWVDLSSLGDDVTSLEFALTSSDVGMFGINTPTYFAIDNLTFQVVPEPECLPTVLVLVMIIAWRWRHR